MCILATDNPRQLKSLLLNARTIYNDNAVYNLILCFTIIYENLRNKRKITKNEVDIPIK